MTVEQLSLNGARKLAGGSTHKQQQHNRPTTQQKQQNIKAKELRFALSLSLSFSLTHSLFSLKTLSVV